MRLKEDIMVKQGGVSWNTGFKSKKGMKGSFKCSVCGRTYKQEWSKENHERQCREFNGEKDGEYTTDY